MPLRSSGSSTSTRRWAHHGGSEIGEDGANGLSQESFTKLGFHLVLFFFYLYSMIVALIKDEAH